MKNKNIKINKDKKFLKNSTDDSPPHEKNAVKPEYAGFWKRLIAIFWDGLFVGAVCIPFMFTQFRSGMFFQRLLALLAVLDIFFILCLVKWGKSPGKYLTGITVKKMDFGGIGPNEAIQRYAVPIFFQVMPYAMVSGTMLSRPEGMSYPETVALLAPEYLNPAYIFVSRGWYVWLFVGVLVLLLNEKKRAAHDFIAGTVVVVDKKR